MSQFTSAPLTRHLPAVFDVLPEHDEQLGQRCALYSDEGVIEAWSWLPCTISRPVSSPWRRDSHQRVSGEPGAVHIRPCNTAFGVFLNPRNACTLPTKGRPS